MAKGIYTGVNSTAQKVKKMYIGVDGKARKIKKGYIGDENGIARIFYTSNEFVQGTFARSESAVTINVGFKPKYLFIWNESPETESTNKFYLFYCPDSKTWTFNNAGSATVSTRKEWGDCAIFSYSLDSVWASTAQFGNGLKNPSTNFSISDTGFTINLSKYTTNATSEINFAAFGEGYTTVEGYFEVIRNQTANVNLGFKPTFMYMNGSGYTWHNITDTKRATSITDGLVLQVNGAYKGLVGERSDPEDDWKAESAYYHLSLATTSNGFSCKSNSANFNSQGYLDYQVPYIGYIAIKPLG